MKSRTIEELVRILRIHSPGLRVVVNGYEEGYDGLSAKQIALVEIALNTGTHDWEGKYGEPRDAAGETPDDAEVVNALVLRRVSN